MISKSHKWENNRHIEWRGREREKSSLFSYCFSYSFEIIIISCETMEEYYLLFEQFTVWPCIAVWVSLSFSSSVCADVCLWLWFSFYYIIFFLIQSLFCSLFSQLCVNRLLMSTTFLRWALWWHRSKSVCWFIRNHLMMFKNFKKFFVVKRDFEAVFRNWFFLLFFFLLNQVLFGEVYHRISDTFWTVK